MEVALHIDYCSGVQKDVREDQQVIFTATTTINRKDFGVKGERWSAVKEGIMAVANEIEIELTVLGKQSKAPNFRNWFRNAQSTHAVIYSVVSEQGVEAGIREFEKLRSDTSKQVNSASLNLVGYMLLKEDKIDDALEIFQHNAKVYPDDANVFDSLGEAYAAKGDMRRAAINYKRVLENDPLNANAMEVLRLMEAPK